MHRRTLSTLLILVLLAAVVPARTVPDAKKQFRPSRKDFQRADKMLARMSLEEKVGQLVHIGVNARYMHRESPEYRRLERLVAERKIGGVILFVGGVYDSVHLVNRLQTASRVPLLIAADFETGLGMRLRETTEMPWSMALAATGDPGLAARFGAVTAREARAVGVHQVYAPVVDVNNNADNPVINVRSFGEDPQEVARFAGAFARGLQSENVLATAKHFPGHGDTSVDSHRGLPVIDLTRERLEETEFVPFRKLIEEGVGSVMISHISMPHLDPEAVRPLKDPVKTVYAESEFVTENATVPATLSRRIVTDILREEMGFDGLIVTDALDMSGLTLYFDQREAAVRSILAGNDVLLKPADAEAAIEGLTGAVRSGRITEERLDRSVRQVLAWKYKLGLFERKLTPLEEIDRTVAGPATHALGEEIARRALTLVRTSDDTLPLRKGGKVLFVAVTNGKDIDWIGTEFAAALRSRGFEVKRIALDERSGPDEIEKALSEAAAADVVVNGLFGRVRTGAKNSAGLPAPGEKALRRILALKDKRTVSVAFGNPYLIQSFPEIRNYVVAYGAMDSLQRAAAAALTGENDFTGRLPITIGPYPRGTGLSLRENSEK